MRTPSAGKSALRHAGDGRARILTRMLVTVMLMGAFIVFTGGPSQAYTQADRNEQTRYSIETVELTYPNFIRRKADFVASTCRRENYIHLGLPTPDCRKPSPYNAFDWTDDGCSGRDQIGFLSLAYRNLFNKPCQLHDFGYRNFGAGLTLDRTEARRAMIDSNFLSEMRRLCNGTYRFNPAKLRDCHAKALLVYGVVSKASNWKTPGPWHAPVDAPSPAPAPAPSVSLAMPTYSVMNTSEAPPDGVWFRNSPHIADTSRITGLGVYVNERVRLRCFAWGDSVGSYANRLWYLTDNVSRPSAAGRANSGYINAHYVNDGLVANRVAPGVPAC